MALTRNGLNALVGQPNSTAPQAPTLQAAAPSPASNPRSRKALTVLASVVVVAALGWAAYGYLVASHYESTDNAMAYTATQAGMALAPIEIMALRLSPLVGKYVGKMDPRRFAVRAFAVFALVLWMRSNFNTQADMGTILIPTLIQGVAMACFFIPLMTITLSGLSHDKIPAALGLRNFVRIAAGSFGTSIATTVWQDRAAMHHAQLSEYVNPGSVAANSALASAGLTPDEALGTIGRLIPLVCLTRPTHASAH